jgi:hypothetical protein
LKLVLHIGLHRAASSSIQHVLQAEAQSLRQGGTAIVTQAMANQPEHRAFKLLRGHMVKRHGLKRLLEQTNRRLDELHDEGMHTVIFSDENMPGFMPGKRHVPFASATAMADIIEALARHHDIKVLCVLREHVGYFRSVHNYRLMRTDCGDFEDFVTGLDLSAFSYTHLLKIMSAAAGARNVRAAAFEAIGGSSGRNVTTALAELSGAQQLLDCPLARTNTGRNRPVVEVMRALNGQGIVLCNKAATARFVTAVAGLDGLAGRTAEDDRRLHGIVKDHAIQCGFAISSERRLRAGLRLARAVRPMTVGRPDRKAFTQALDTAASRLAAASHDETFASQLWRRFADDRAEIARTWLPEWRALPVPPAG